MMLAFLPVASALFKNARTKGAATDRLSGRDFYYNRFRHMPEVT